MLIRSYTRSTDFNRVSHGKNVMGCVDISVVVDATSRTVPFTNIQRQLAHNMPTVPTPFRAREPAVDSCHSSPIPVRFIAQLTDKLTPSRITDCSRELAVFEHILHSQVFHDDVLVFPHQSGRQLVQKIFARIGNLCLNPSHLDPCLSSIVRPFYLAAQCFLSFAQSLVKSVKRFRIGNLFTCTEGCQGCNSQINPNRVLNGRHWFDSWIVHQNRNKPSSCWVQPDGYSRRLTVLRNLSRPADRQRFSTFCQGQMLTIPPEGRLCEFSTAAVPLLFEGGILRCSGPKVFVSRLQMPQALLDRHTAYFVQKLEVILFFSLRQYPRRFHITDSLLAFIECFSAKKQHFVVDQSHTAQRSSKQVFLLGSWVGTISKGTLHSAFHFSKYFVRLRGIKLLVSRSSPSPPCRHRFAWLKKGVSRRF